MTYFGKKRARFLHFFFGQDLGGGGGEVLNSHLAEFPQIAIPAIGVAVKEYRPRVSLCLEQV